MRIVFYSIIFASIATSCAKEKTEVILTNDCNLQTVDSVSEVEFVPNNFFPLTIGSYWIYEFASHHPDGTVTNINQTDTVRITGDTIIGDHIYSVFSSNYPNSNAISFRRNSKGAIVAPNGGLVCPKDSTYIPSYNYHYGKTGNNDTIYYYWESFSGYDNVNATIGDFDCILKSVNHDYWPNFGVGLVIDTIYFSPIGILQTSFSFGGGIKTVGTLIDYHVE